MYLRSIKGYKVFNNNMTNRYGVKFLENNVYKIELPLKFGINGNGFHFCKNLEDCLRYVNAFKEEIKIAEVTGYNDFIEYNDEYYGYYDMYVTSTISIDKILSREEIIQMFLNTYDERVIRFLSSMKLTEKEKDLFKLKYYDNRKIQLALSYYQDNIKDAYIKEYRKYQAPQKVK